MDDVIFAGTPQRPALGRAEVSLTIDNTAGLLPIEFSEVTITRTLFRAGDSEYQINGAPCRLLDIQELLSDTGIGRQQHVIVGPGPARHGPELAARGPAGGHRGGSRDPQVPQAPGAGRAPSRGDRGQPAAAERPLREVRRQLTPLQKQADAARRHDGVVAELRALRLHLAGHEIAGLQARIERLRDQRRRARTRARREYRGRLRVLDVAVLDAEQTLGAMGDDSLGRRLVRVEALRERRAVFARSSRRSAAGSTVSSRPPPTKVWSRRWSRTPTRLRAELAGRLDAVARRPCTAPGPDDARARRGRSCVTPTSGLARRRGRALRAGGHVPTRSTLGRVPPGLPPAPSTLAGLSRCRRARSSTTWRSKPAPRPRSRRRSATRCARSSCEGGDAAAAAVARLPTATSRAPARRRRAGGPAPAAARRLPAPPARRLVRTARCPASARVEPHARGRGGGRRGVAHRAGSRARAPRPRRGHP